MVEITSNLSNLIDTRKEKIKTLRTQGIDPYPLQFKRTHTLTQFQEKFQQLSAGEKSTEEVSLAGRLMSVREMGKSLFADLQDGQDKIQIYLRAEFVSEPQFNLFRTQIDIGDFMGFYGEPFRTRTGELTLAVKKFVILGKSLRPLPEKWHGLKDLELRYRQRYLDLLVNPETRNLFKTRSAIIQNLRNFLNEQGFVEVETPMMQPLFGGATARPFSTYHNALDLNLYLRVAPELYLKRLLVGGWEKVYELNRCFRNEGISVRHNPEFTMLELYQAYVDYNEIADLCESMLGYIIAQIVPEPHRVKEWQYQNLNLDLSSPWQRKSLTQLFTQYTGEPMPVLWQEDELKNLAGKLNVTIEKNMPVRKIFDRIFDHYVVPHLLNPTFVFDFPLTWSPLAKSKPESNHFAARFELYIAGEEIANAYCELNDSQEQRLRMEVQVQEKNKFTDDEIAGVDEDYLMALEYGIPPCSGLGVGIDRLVMILTNSASIRDVILFPLLRAM